MVGKYGKMKAPKKQEEELDLDLDLEGAEGEEEIDMPGESDLAAISDDELLAELAARGLAPEGEEDMEYDEESMEDEDMDLA